ncbi:MAG: carboxylating nicotinate-nucleotide diphosphorylase [Zetaproteobacteria bacterium]|nr:MAG: carboxylating nicotinate-nucleotide diphosphorylase [Zetaproteobacteria bacterium]
MNRWMHLIELALAEDAALHDLTAQATIDERATGHACIVAKADGILSGTELAYDTFHLLDASIEQLWLCHDGESVKPGDTVVELAGPLRSLLAAERTALNFLQHLSGIASETQRFVEAVAGTGCIIVDTRKTTPGWRWLEKKAVRDGGGSNHRMNLSDGMLIKENHIQACGSITRAVACCRQLRSDCWIEVECETLDQVDEAVTCAPDLILLDNMSPELVAQARARVPDSITLEASGNITLANAKAYAQTGVDRLAIGSITHSAPVLDLSMRVVGNPS